MKTRLLYFAFFYILSLQPFTSKAQAVNTQDSLALVDLYNSTNGPGWFIPWHSALPVSTWYGVLVENGRVSKLQLANNRLVGNLPVSLGNLTGLTNCDLSYNQLQGNIPASTGNLSGLFMLNLSHNQLSGAVPSALNNLPLFIFLILNDNKFTFGDIEALNSPSANHSLIYSPQEEIPLHQDGTTLYVSTGGTLANNVYKWYNDDVLIATKTADSTFVPVVPGNYSAEVTNSLLPDLTLYSYSNANLQDSLALVDLYNSTNGSGWKNHSNWLTASPISLWYGVAQAKGRVRKLELVNNNLTGTLPSSLQDIAYLNNLSLNTNLITGAIPTSIGNLSQLTDLFLYSNLFTGMPATLGDIQNLSNIQLSNNNLTGTIPSSFGNLSNLKFLNLGTNHLSGTIPDSLGRLSNLQWLTLSYNQISGNIPASLTDLSNLTDLSLDNNQLSGTIPDSLAKNSKLTNISLGNNHLTGHIPDSLQNIAALRHLYLNDNSLSGPIPTSLKKLSRLIELRLQNNMFTFDGMETLPVTTFAPASYAPQANIPLKRKGNLVYVSPGGTLTNNTFQLYKNSALFDSKSADSTFIITSAGNYYVKVNNSIATLLTLSTDPVAIAGLMLADTTISVTQNVNGLSAADVQDTPYYKLVLTVTPLSGVNALAGDVVCKVTIDPTVASYKNQPYVQRHYDITPANNAANATANVKLYFTQQEFDNFNAFPAHGLDLPTGPADVAGIANLRVYQYHGFSTTSLPGSYSGNAVEIDPADANIVWNTAAQYWEVSFDVTGFSGFFVSSQNNALLPLTLLSFTGKLQGKNALLQWVTTKETNTSYFELQRGINGNSFDAIAKIAAAGNSNNNLNYQYADLPGTSNEYYYRLKMVDIDGRFSYSNIVKIVNAPGNLVLTVYPNPARESVFIHTPPAIKGAKIELLDIAGRTLQVIMEPAGATQTRLNLKHLPQGIYKIVFHNGAKSDVKTLVIE